MTGDGIFARAGSEAPAPVPVRRPCANGEARVFTPHTHMARVTSWRSRSISASRRARSASEGGPLAYQRPRGPVPVQQGPTAASCRALAPRLPGCARPRRCERAPHVAPLPRNASLTRVRPATARGADRADPCGVAPRALGAAPPGRPSGTSRRGSPVSHRGEPCPSSRSLVRLRCHPGHTVPRTEQVYNEVDGR